LEFRSEIWLDSRPFRSTGTFPSLRMIPGPSLPRVRDGAHTSSGGGPRRVLPVEASGVPEDQEAVLGRMGGESSSARNRTDFVGCCQEGVWEGREREGAQGRYSY